VREACLAGEMFLVTSVDDEDPTRTLTRAWRSGAYLAQARSCVAIENLNEHFKSIFDAYGPLPTKGRLDTARASLSERFSSTNWRCSTVTSKLQPRTVDSKPSSEPLEQL
jgi:hypothetical protein